MKCRVCINQWHWEFNLSGDLGSKVQLDRVTNCEYDQGLLTLKIGDIVEVLTDLGKNYAKIEEIVFDAKHGMGRSNKEDHLKMRVAWLYTRHELSRNGFERDTAYTDQSTGQKLFTSNVSQFVSIASISEKIEDITMS